MFRIAKPESFVLLSPSKQDVRRTFRHEITQQSPLTKPQVGKQNAAECMPLIMEPLSAFYNGPLLVLDFQSLYPSVMIAYNYCYSTCLGRVADFQGRNKLGVTDLDLPSGLLEKLQDHITSSSVHPVHSCTLLTAVLSRAERHHVRQAYSTTGSFRPDVDRTVGHACDGETGDEGRQERQGACLFRVLPLPCVCLSDLMLVVGVVGTEPDTGRAAARAQVYRQCHVWLHERDVFRADACSRDCRQYRTERSGNA